PAVHDHGLPGDLVGVARRARRDARGGAGPVPRHHVPPPPLRAARADVLRAGAVPPHARVLPPLTAIFCPVTNFAPSEARCAPAPATASAPPMCPMGTARA